MSIVGRSARSPANYTVTFFEEGITIPPVPTPFWQVTLNGTPETSATGTITFAEPNGTYGFTASATGYVAYPASGRLTVAGAPVSLTISFTSYVPATYNVTFVESNLPRGTNWSVTLRAAGNYSTGSSMLFPGFENGTYPFTVQASNGWIPDPANGTINVSGKDQWQRINFSAPPPPPPPPTPEGLGLRDVVTYSAIAAAVVIGLGIWWFGVRPRRRRAAKKAAAAAISPGPQRGPVATPVTTRRRGFSPFVHYALMRLALIPVQLVFILWILYLAIVVPPQLSRLTGVTFFTGFGTMVANIFTGNWGLSNTVFQLPWFTLYVDFLPTSLQIALFALPISAVIAYSLALGVGWSRRPAADVPVRLTTLALGLIPVFIVAMLVESALFFLYVHAFHSIPGNGIIPDPSWWGGLPPPWIIDGWITRPTGFPIIDGLVHGDWAFEEITIVKTLIQGIAVAVVYVAIFLRHGRSIVAAASREPHVTAARSRGIPERTLLWRHTARRVIPSFLVLFALTIPAYLVTQFVVESLFQDPGVGRLTITLLTSGGSLTALEGMIFVLAGFVLVAAYLTDLFAARADPRGALAR